MMLIPRFYYVVNKDNHILRVDNKRHNKKRYIIRELQKTQRFFVYYDELCNGKFINIEDTYYYRPDWDKSKDWVFNNICMKCDITNDGHVMFQRNTRDLSKIYPYHQDLYYVFHTFEEFRDWMMEDDTRLIWKVLPYKRYNIDDYRDLFVSYIQNHFEEREGNLFLMKIKFKNDNTL